jgi:signal transduction histidine kinase
MEKLAGIRNMASNTSKPAAGNTRGRVLIVDDDVDLAEAMEDILISLGYETRVTHSAAATMAIVDDFQPGVALLDNRLGADSGVALLAELKEKRPDLVCLIITAYAEAESAIEALRHGAYDYLQKPINPREVLATLERSFEKIRLEEKARTAFEELEAAKNQAEASSRAKTEFLKTISHELRTPLNAIIGFSDVLIGQGFGPLGSERYVDYAKSIQENGDRLLNIINNVIDIAKLDSHKLELHEDSVQLRKLISTAVDAIDLKASESGLSLEVDLPQELPYVIADEPKLRQVLMNLFSNAIKFTESPGKIALRVRWGKKGRLEFEIEDTGIGIEKDKIPEVFKPFSRTDLGLDRSFDGMGLGLPIARAIVELHDGELTMQSELEKGTKVSFFLPEDRIIQKQDAVA